ncbi:MAG: efflux RND transporter permease subunit, partial [Hymenobacteraceae bacterium]|nr:efflux RND transporter permease subunit [Hymenobacteraceae bacterium]MDX5396733.1 efflux RND transporter permease subunit [Hymenobacteraceae bacterium]MDX5512795.1 efflux RND transporter permease subunit [Hymenobacteraceae bacterium]
GTPGVADISSLGGYLKQYEVAINPQRLHSLGISISDIFQALEQNNENTGGAYIDKKPNLYFIRGIGLVENIKDIEQIVVKNTPNGNPIFIRDVADVQLGNAPRYGAMTRNTDGEVVGGIVMMLKGANSNEVIQNVQARILTIQKSLPEGVVIEPFLDRSNLVKRAINTVTKNLVEGALIVIFVLVLLLGNLRAGLLVASVIPLSMLFAFGMMDVFGVSGNLMSLGALDFGLIVDGAVIIVEGVVHRIAVQSNLLPPRLNQKQMDEEVFASSSRIMKSATFGMLIILIVYLPILALTGIEGKMFKPMAETVSFAIIGALILSLTYVPMMATLVLSKNTSHKPNFSDKIIAFVHRFYKPVISWALHHKTMVVGSAVVVLAASFWLFTRLGGEFIPSLDEGDFALEVRMMPGTSLSQSIETSTKVSEILLRDFPEVKETIGKIGSSEIPTDPMPVEANDFMVLLKDKDEWNSATTKDELADKMNESLQAMPGVIFGFQQPIQL